MPTDAADSRTGPLVDAPARAVNYLELTFALMGGAVAWLLRLVVNSALVAESCRLQATWPLWVTSAVTVAIGGVALLSARRYLRVGGDGPDHGDSAHWLALLAVIFNVTAIAGIVLETLPVLFLDICRAAPGG